MARKGLYGVTRGRWQMSNFSDNHHPPCNISTNANFSWYTFSSGTGNIPYVHTMYNISPFYLNSFLINNIVTGGNSDAAAEHLHLMISGTSSSLFCIIPYVPTEGMCIVWFSGGWRPDPCSCPALYFSLSSSHSISLTFFTFLHTSPQSFQFTFYASYILHFFAYFPFLQRECALSDFLWMETWRLLMSCIVFQSFQFNSMPLTFFTPNTSVVGYLK